MQNINYNSGSQIFGLQSNTKPQKHNIALILLTYSPSLQNHFSICETFSRTRISHHGQKIQSLPIIKLKTTIKNYNLHSTKISKILCL